MKTNLTKDIQWGLNYYHGRGGWEVGGKKKSPYQLQLLQHVSISDKGSNHDHLAYYSVLKHSATSLRDIDACVEAQVHY